MALATGPSGKTTSLESGMKFKVGDKVTWTSAANGSWKEKTGEIVQVVKGRRGEPERYKVSVPTGTTGKAKPKIYMPRTSALKPA